jgi:hypothetical protein
MKIKHTLYDKSAQVQEFEHGQAIHDNMELN